MADDYAFTVEEMAIDGSVGYPRAYAKLCRDRSGGPYAHGPPFTFMPYCLPDNEALKVGELDQLFPIIDPKAKRTAKPKIFLSLLWKQLSHLGNAGFDPAVIRVDPYGNVLYYHADSASPLAWDIDHWFPCSRGGLTVPSNLRILQWQACKKKHSKLEFLIPWWDLQLGISVNQFLSIFATANSDFRHRAFSFLFFDGENEELNSSQAVNSHSFPQHFVESKEQLGLAPAAIVTSRRESYGSSSILQSLDYNRIRSGSPATAARKVKTSKENENPDALKTPYEALVVARDSLKQREEAAKMQAEVQKLDNEVSEMRRKNEEEKLSIQDLELELIKRRRRAEKCRKLAETQSSYRTMLEKMIRDAMHQSVVYKEQVRLNQAAANALMARLEAQKAICDASEKELHKKYKQRDELEKQIRPEWEQARKRSRMDDTLNEERDQKQKQPIFYLPGMRPRTPLHKELRAFLEEEHKASEAGLSQSDQENRNERAKELKNSEKECPIDERRERERGKSIVIIEDDNIGEQHKYCTSGLSQSDQENRNERAKELKNSEKECPIDERRERERGKSIVIIEDDNIGEQHKYCTSEVEEERKHRFQLPLPQEPEIEEDEESRKKRGKGNVEKWLQMLLENAQEEDLEEQPPQLDKSENETNKMTDDIISKLNLKYPQKEGKHWKSPESEDTRENMIAKQIQKEKQQHPQGKENSEKSEASKDVTEGVERRSQSVGKERKLVRSESTRAFRRIPSSPSIILGMKKGVECIGKKPMVSGDDEVYEEQHIMGGNGFLKSSFRTIKKVVRI